MKKIVPILLAFALCLSCLAACGSGETQTESTKLIGVCIVRNAYPTA